MVLVLWCLSLPQNFPSDLFVVFDTYIENPNNCDVNLFKGPEKNKYAVLFHIESIYFLAIEINPEIYTVDILLFSYMHK